MHTSYLNICHRMNWRCMENDAFFFFYKMYWLWAWINFFFSFRPVYDQDKREDKHFKSNNNDEKLNFFIIIFFILSCLKIICGLFFFCIFYSISRVWCVISFKIPILIQITLLTTATINFLSQKKRGGAWGWKYYIKFWKH